eukprot:c36211_g1_i1 orf=31-1095(+)
MEIMAKSLIAKLLPKFPGRTEPWTYLLWKFIEQAKGGISKTWNHMSAEELVLSTLPIKIKHSSLFEGVIRTLKSVGQVLKWKGKPKAIADSSLMQSIWWQRNITERTQPGVCFGKEVISISKKGIHRWHQLWNDTQDRWWSPEVIRQRYKLNDREVGAIRELLNQMLEDFPTNIRRGGEDPIEEWVWNNGKRLDITKTKAIYTLLSTEQDWHTKLNCRWKRLNSEVWWKRRCFKIWHGTPFPKINLWNWRIMTGSLLTGDKLRYRKDVLGLCPWCKAASETTIHLFWGCPTIRGFWGKFNKYLRLVFGQVNLAAHMVLLGSLRNHSKEFSLCWQLIRSAATEQLWKARNKRIFQ